MAAESITKDTIKRYTFTEAVDVLKENIGARSNFILTFGNAWGKQMARIANMIRTTSNNVGINPDVFVLSIDPLFKDDTIWVPFLSNLKPTFAKEHIFIEPLKEGYIYFSSTDDETRPNSSGYNGELIFVDEGMPSQYFKNNLEFTEQILKDRTFAYADTCIPSEDNPANALNPLIKEILDSGGTVYIDNDAWIDMKGHIGRNHKITNYLQNRYMEFYCEVMYILKQFKSPRILFYNGDTGSRQVQMKDFIPLDAMFTPNTFVKKGLVIMNQEPTYSAKNATGGRRHRTKRRRHSKLNTKTIKRRNSRTYRT
jgi:hypothetical protein